MVPRKSTSCSSHRFRFSHLMGVFRDRNSCVADYSRCEERTYLDGIREVLMRVAIPPAFSSQGLQHYPLPFLWRRLWLCPRSRAIETTPIYINECDRILTASCASWRRQGPTDLRLGKWISSSLVRLLDTRGLK